MARTRDDLLELFEEQIEFLGRSNELFDQGYTSEAKRLAVPLRVLFHNTSTSRALINQLDLQDKLTWVDTAGLPDPRNLLPHTGLFQMGISIENGKGKPVLRAPLSDRPPALMRTTGGPSLPRGSRIDFEAWWNNSVMRDSEGTEFSRRIFVLDLCNKEGGAHVDPVSPAGYTNLATGNSMPWTFREGNGPEGPLSNPVFYSMRQISHEVLESVRQQPDQIR